MSDIEFIRMYFRQHIYRKCSKVIPRNQVYKKRSNQSSERHASPSPLLLIHDIYNYWVQIDDYLRKGMYKKKSIKQVYYFYSVKVVGYLKGDYKC